MGRRERTRAWQARLLREGVAVVGTVALPAPDVNHHGTNSIRYRYQTSDGKERTRTVTVPLLIAVDFTPGQRLTILYNPAHPDESCPYAAITDAEIV